MKRYNVTGMSCAACQARVEKAVSAVPGVTECSVSLLTNSMGVSGDASDTDIIKAVEKAGYGASVAGKERKSESNDTEMDEAAKLLKRLLTSLAFLIVLMYFSMGHPMLGLPVPEFFKDNPVAIGLIQLLLTIMVMVINQKFFISGFKSLIGGAPNMDTLVALGASAAFGYSTVMLFAMTGRPDMAHSYLHDMYFESAAMILTLITVGKMLEARAKGKTTDALKSLTKLTPKTATIIVDGKQITVPAEDIKLKNIFIVKPGEVIPADGVVLSGESAVNEAAMTGESIPVDKKEGSHVSAGTINTSGAITCEATGVGKDTTLAQIIQMVSDAAATKAPIAKIADKVSGIFVPTVIIIATITTIIWLLIGKDIGYSLARGISVLVISCPCSLGLATPVAIMVGHGKAAKNGILFKTAAALEVLHKADIVAFDKTGTITKGQPQVASVYQNDERLLAYAYSLESLSEHPLAKAVVEYCEAKGIKGYEINGFEALTGNGLKAYIDGEEIKAGSLKYIASQIKLDAEAIRICDSYSDKGNTPVLFATKDKLLGIMAIADVIKDDSAQAIAELKRMGIKTVMITGDNPKTAEAIGIQAGVDKVFAGVMPGDKERIISLLMERGKTVMVGDGVNDAPALTRADMGIAIGAGTDVAIDAADIVLMKNSLRDAVAAIRLSAYTIRNIHENLFWAFFYNVCGIPLAAGAFISLLGWELNPMFGAAAMSLSSFCVVSNALRLNLCKIYETNKRMIRERDIELDIDFKMEEKTMTKTINITGMMCGHCEATVKKALEALPQVSEAVVSHTTGTAVVTLDSDVADDVLKETVEAKDFTVTGIE